jgi:hypothetical protein
VVLKRRKGRERRGREDRYTRKEGGRKKVCPRRGRGKGGAIAARQQRCESGSGRIT